MPAPGTVDDIGRIGFGSLPAQFIPNALTRRHQTGGVARASRPHSGRNFDARHALACIDNLSNAEPFAIAQVISAVAGVEQGLRWRGGIKHGYFSGKTRDQRKRQAGHYRVSADPRCEGQRKPSRLPLCRQSCDSFTGSRPIFVSLTTLHCPVPATRTRSCVFT